jgi:hypothetical protein
MIALKTYRTQDMKTQGNEQGAPGPLKRPIGQILVDAGFITEEKLHRALGEQQRTNELLGEILVRLGEISPIDLNIALSLQKDLADPDDAVKTAAGVRKMLGEILLQARRITPEQLDAALQEQKRTGEKLGETLLRFGILSPRELEAALTFQRNHSSDPPLSVRLRLGELLVSAGYITRDQLAGALDRQRHTQKKLGEVLIDAGYVQPDQVAHGLKLQSMLLTAALTAALSLTQASPAHAETMAGRPAGAKVLVSAVVPAHASVKVLRQPGQLTVTDADVRRGFVEIGAESLIELKNNSLAGCLLVFESRGLPFKEAVVRGLGREVAIGPGGGMIFQAFRGTITASLSYRFVLSDDAQPGAYDWPFSLSASPL